MNFDLNWFTTVPGMLISCGVLLLFVALIVFIVSSVKSKKEKNPMDVEETTQSEGSVANGDNLTSENVSLQQIPPVQSQQVMNSTASLGNVNVDGGVNSTAVNETQQNVVPISPVVSEVPVMNTVAPIAPVVPEAPVMNTVAPIAPVVPEAPVMNTVAPIAPVVPEVPVIDAVAPIAPVVPEVPVIDAVTPIAPVVPEVPVMDVATPVASVQPVIYGGASPIVSDINFGQDVPHQIYGGANPLENTQSIPIASIPSVQPAVNSQPTMIAPQAPVVQEAVAPIVETIQ